MSQFDKLLHRIRSIDKNLRFEEIQKVLEHFGYTMGSPRGGSSHRSFRKPGHPPITIPRNEPVKRAYIEMVRDMIESEENDNEES